MQENQDIFQEIYPASDDETSESSDDEDDSLPEGSDDENPSRAKQDLQEVRNEIQALNDEIKRAAEMVSSAESRLKMLDGFSNKVEPKSGSDMSDVVQAYQDQRNKTFEDHMEGTLRQRELKNQVCSLKRTEGKLVTQVDKERKTALRAYRKEKQARLKKRDLKNRREAKKYAEKERIQHERCKFWARSCFVVRITLDATQYTPISRRSSISSVTDLVKPAAETPESSLAETEAAVPNCDLSITYVTSAAFWCPSYDLQLSTTSNAGTLFFDAQLNNNTSESWNDCKIILSTSQAVFSGLQDAIPALIPWHIKLANKSSAGSDDITSSPQEAYEQRKWKVASGAASQAASGTRWIGVSAAQVSGRHGKKMQTVGHAVVHSGVPSNNPSHGAILFGSKSSDAPQPPPRDPSTKNLFDSADRATQPQPRISGGGLFGISTKNAPQPSLRYSGGGLFGTAAATSRGDQDYNPDTLVSLDETATFLEPEPELSFQESTVEETGFTTTYDLPGTKSLVPSSTASKQRVAQIAFTNVVFSHTIVAKYRPGAFLKAKLRNASKISLLKGPVGLTLDGTFMGRSTLPRCSSGDDFTMSLGIDPTIRVIYPKPDVKRSTSGVFTKESSTAYTRSITVVNTRGPSSAGGKAARLRVLDQVPVSEDDKLRVEIVQPRGLVEGGAGVSAGAQDATVKDGKDWGKAVATLRKGGEVKWDVELNAGKSVKLGLEYDVSLPAGDHAVQG